MVLKFMDNKKNDRYYATIIIEHIDAIKGYMANKSYEEFVQDSELVDAVMFRLIQLIENIKCVSDEYKQKNSHIPWGNIMGFRNGIVHEYGKTDYVIVYETATQDIDELRELFMALL